MARRKRWPGAGHRATRREIREAGASETIVLVHHAGDADITEPSARGLLTHPEGVLVCDPPQELLDGELVAVVATRSAGGELARAEPERIAVRRGVTLSSSTGTVTGVVLGLAAPAAAPATPLVGSHDAFLTALRGGTTTGGAALVNGGLLEPDQLIPLPFDIRSALEATRLTKWDAELEPRGGRWRFLCFIFRCR